MNVKHLLTDKVFQEIGAVAEKEGIKVFVIGGFVRDLLLKRQKKGGAFKDLDLVVEGSGIAFAEAVSQHLITSKVSYFKNFGTAMFRYGDWEVEVVGARKESYNRNSRKPIVEDGTLQEDQERRDFTINALSISLNKSDFGELIDPFDGIADLKKKVIQTPLDPVTTYSDDPLRMLRAIRFATQLEFTIAPSSYQAIADQKERMKIISRERVAEELNKILQANKPSIGFRLLFSTGLLHQFIPELVALQGIEEKGNQSHKDNFYHTIQVVDQLCERSDNLWLRWAALLHDIGKAPTKKFVEGTGWTFHNHEFVGAKMVPRIFRRLKLPLDDKLRYVKKMVRLSSRPVALTNDVSDSAVRRLLFEAGDDIDELMILAESDITSKNKRKVKQFLANFKEVRQKLKDVEEKDRLRNFQPPISGKEIMDTFGLSPGKQIGILKEAIKDAILEGEISNNHEEAFAYLIKKGEELGLQPVETN